MPVRLAIRPMLAEQALNDQQKQPNSVHGNLFKRTDPLAHLNMIGQSEVSKVGLFGSVADP